MIDSSYQDSIQKLSELTNLSSEKQETFFQQVLIVSSATLGILVSLHSPQTEFLYIRAVFVASIVLLSLGTLTSAIALYDLSHLAERVCRKLHSEIGTALREERKVQNIFVRKKKRTLFCEKCSLVLLVLGLLSIVAYTVMVNFS